MEVSRVFLEEGLISTVEILDNLKQRPLSEIIDFYLTTTIGDTYIKSKREIDLIALLIVAKNELMEVGK